MYWECVYRKKTSVLQPFIDAVWMYFLLRYLEVRKYGGDWKDVFLFGDGLKVKTSSRMMCKLFLDFLGFHCGIFEVIHVNSVLAFYGIRSRVLSLLLMPQFFFILKADAVVQEVANEDEDVKEVRRKAAQNEEIKVNMVLDFCRSVFSGIRFCL